MAQPAVFFWKTARGEDRCWFGVCQLPGLRQVEHDGRLLSHTGGNSIGMLLGDLIPTEAEGFEWLGGSEGR